jgi:hypothetical protein
MDSNSSGGASSMDSSLFTRISNCSGCQKRKEYVQNMFNSSFFIGLAVGVGGVYAYHKWVKK